MYVSFFTVLPFKEEDLPTDDNESSFMTLVNMVHNSMECDSESLVVIIVDALNQVAA